MTVKINSFISSYIDETDLEEKIMLVKKAQNITIEIDWKKIWNKIDLFNLFYRCIDAPDSFWRNWAAFWDTIRDQDFWVWYTF